MELEELLEELRGYPGLKRKAVIADWAPAFEGGADFGLGDDAGHVPFGEGYLLMSCEGIWPPLLDDPPFAGLCAVTAGVNDIYATGGRPLGFVSVVFPGGFSDSQREGFLSGMGSGLEHYGVPLLGGHTGPDGDETLVAVAVVGFAGRLLKGNGARPGDEILAALDLEGRPHPRFNAWDTVTGAEGKRTLGMLEGIVLIAERGLASSCKDISNPGLLGTLAMMLESSGAGAKVVLDDIRVPQGIELSWWLKAYPSYGFLLSVPGGNSEEVKAVLDAAAVECARIGEITSGSELLVEWRGSGGVFLDWRRTPVTGLFH